MTASSALPGDAPLPVDAIEPDVLADRSLIIAANRAPVTFEITPSGEQVMHRGSGGLISALLGLANHTQPVWIGCARTAADAAWRQGAIPLPDGDRPLQIHFLTPAADAYDGYYHVIANPLLWFLHHSMWDVSHAPLITRATWRAWDQGYQVVNRQFAEAIAEHASRAERRPLIMLQDYHLYLAPRYVRELLRPRRDLTLLHFIHIPWPGPSYWRILPGTMRQAILDGLCAVDLLGLQTREDALNFIRTCESYLPGVHVNFKRGRIWYRNHATHVRDFPISIDVAALRRLAEGEVVAGLRRELEGVVDQQQLIVRIDRIEPSKNIVRGFKAFEELLELHPEHRNRVKFLALLVPSRLEVEEYQAYLDELMAAAGRVNALYGDSSWEPIRILVGEDYPRAVAALQLYDVLLVNAIADGMNLVAKEGPIVNQRDGVLILSERTGARQQLEPGAIVIAPCDVYATAEALHQALTLPASRRRDLAARLTWQIEREDIMDWLHKQLQAVKELGL